MERSLLKRLKKQRAALLMLIPFLIWYSVFYYVPLFGWYMAFSDYRIGKGMFEGKFVGLKHFEQFIFKSGDFLAVLRNSLVLNILNLGLGILFSILLAIMINEVNHQGFRKIVQAVSALPYLISWAVVAGIMYIMLSIDGGVINDALISMGIIDTPIYFMAKPEYSWALLTFANVWKVAGWRAIVFTAAIASIDQQLYDAADIDGAGRWGRIIHVVLPGIAPTVTVVLLLAAGQILNTGFEQYYLLGNSLTRDMTDVIDTYSIRYGLENGLFSYATAVGVFKTVVGVSVFFTANFMSSKITGKKII